MEYLSLVLCRDVYHCDPLTLKRQPLKDVMTHLTCLDVEAMIRDMEAEASRQAGPIGRAKTRKTFQQAKEANG